MNESYIKDILEKVESGAMETKEAFGLLKELPYKDLGFANVDHHRTVRTGFPEIIFCEGKTSEQIRDIFAELKARRSENGRGLMGTRATAEDFACVAKALPEAVYHEEARIIEIPSTAKYSPWIIRAAFAIYSTDKRIAFMDRSSSGRTARGG